MSEVIRRSESADVELRSEDGKYVVVVAGECVLRTGVLNAAEAEYADAVNSRSEVIQRKLASERKHFDMQAARSESFARRAASARKTGGKGGRGGV